MKWKKLGKIFDPTHCKLPNDCFEFAQAPQVLAFDNHIRIYFSTRKVDDLNGKYLSHIAFVDMKKNLRDILNVSKNTVIPLGQLGCFDEHGIFPMNVLRHEGRVYGYTCGWSRRVSVSVETGIGLVESHDNGDSFVRIGNGPILSSTLKEPFLVGDAFVKVFNGEFHMWYIYGTMWKKYSKKSLQADRTYKIGHAISNDGINWSKVEGTQIIPDKLGNDESQALPTVILINDVFHMFFCYRQSFDFRSNSSRGYRIGHAFSYDLETWIRDDDTPSIDVAPCDWDSDMLCYPHVFELSGNIYLLYNGNEFGRFGFGLAQLEYEK